MKKKLLLVLLTMLSFNAIHAEITWKLSDDGTLTISGTDMPNYYLFDDMSLLLGWVLTINIKSRK